ncbi:MAG: hypothetical protein EP335_06595 [Alphaproteobacteria bacterium]|nr:MAG: hypothetical protein EP335_06595 [Alphaproteobacteria bacterium]
MGELQVALALAVSMLIFSNLVTAFVEVVHRVFTLRKHGMKMLLERFYDQEVKDRLGTLWFSGVEKDSQDASRGRFLLQMWSGLNSRPPRGGFASVSRSKLGIIPLPELDGSIDKMDISEFARRLAGTEVGRAIARRADTEVNTLIDDLATRFEDYGQQVSQYFKRRSQVISVLAAVAFAVLMNVNVVTLVRAFQADEALTDRLVSQADATIAAYQAQQQARTDNRNQADGDTQVEGATHDEIKAQVAKLTEQVDAARALGLPIGWTGNVPFNGADINRFLEAGTVPGRQPANTTATPGAAETPPPTAEPPAKATAGATEPQDVDLMAPAFWAWLGTTLITGLLIGLGGPFWYDIVRGLAAATRLAGAMGGKKAEDTADGSGTTPASKEEVLKADARDAFRTASNADSLIASIAPDFTTDWKGPRALRL